jgi:hypothetical protein
MSFCQIEGIFLLQQRNLFCNFAENESRMSRREALQLFGDKKIRTAWSEEEEKWYFSIVDVVSVLTDSADASAYWRKLKERLLKEGNETVTHCHTFKMRAADGKMRQTDVANQEQLFRLIQSIPSPKAEPFKQWMAQVASERIDEMQDPEKAIDRGYEYYRRLGYSEAWINERMKGKDARKALTDEWQRTGVSGQQYATLTDIITQEWSGMTTRQYKNFKGLKKENLRDHMTRTESALNTLAEVAATELSQKVDPKGFTEQKSVAKRGGKVAATARRELEKQLGQSVVTRQNAKVLSSPEAPKEIEEQ